MTAMPQLVAIFNGVGGGAAALISIIELLHLHSLGLKPAVYVTAEVLLGVLIGSVSFSGSAIAFIKLQELITGRPITYPGQQVINALVGVAIARHGDPGTGHRQHRLRLSSCWPGPGARRDLRAPHRRRRRAGAHLAAQLVHRPGRGRIGLRARQRPPDRGRDPGRCLGHHPHPPDELRHGPLAAQHPLQRLRLGDHGHRRRGGRRVTPGSHRHARGRGRAAGLRPQGGHHPRATAWPWPRPSTRPGSWPMP